MKRVLLLEGVLPLPVLLLEGGLPLTVLPLEGALPDAVVKEGTWVGGVKTGGVGCFVVLCIVFRSAARGHVG